MAAPFPTVSVGDRYLVSFVGSLAGQRILSTFWYTNSSLVGFPTADAFYDEIFAKIDQNTELRGFYQGVCPSNYTMEQVWIQKVDPSRVAKKVYTVSYPGQLADASQNPNVAATIERRGAVANRHNVGSLHVPGPTTVMYVDGGTWKAAYKTLLDGLGGKMIEALTLGSGSIIEPILRYGPGTLQFTFISTFFSQPTTRVMRRRTVGVGE